MLSHIWLSAAPWTVTCQVPLPMKFSWQECMLSGVPFPTPVDLPNPGIKPVSLESPALAGRFFTTSATWEAPIEPPGKPIYLSILLLKEISLFSFFSLLCLTFTIMLILSYDSFLLCLIMSLRVKKWIIVLCWLFSIPLPTPSLLFLILLCLFIDCKSGILCLWLPWASFSWWHQEEIKKQKEREVKVSPPLCLPALRQWLRACPYLQALPPPPFLAVPPPLFLPLLSSIRLFPCLVPLSLGMLFFDWPQQPLFTPLTGATHL